MLSQRWVRVDNILVIKEIFKSISGEVNGDVQGRITTFVRTCGCSLKCSYCDTSETQDIRKGFKLTIPYVVSEVKRFKGKYVCITGGEPLLQKNTLKLCEELYDRGFIVSIETNNTFPIKDYRKFVSSFVLDYKLEFQNKMLNEMNFPLLKEKDVIKFVITSDKDFIKALEIYNENLKGKTRAIVAFSPDISSIDSASLAKLMIASGAEDLVFSLQIHKVLNLK